jgi:hypothetical protein
MLTPFLIFNLNWGAGIRTPIGRSRVGSPTVERHPNVVSEKYDTLTLKPCQAIFSLLTIQQKPIRSRICVDFAKQIICPKHNKKPGRHYGDPTGMSLRLDY